MKNFVTEQLHQGSYSKIISEGVREINYSVKNYVLKKSFIESLKKYWMKLCLNK